MTLTPRTLKLKLKPSLCADEAVSDKAHRWWGPAESAAWRAAVSGRGPVRPGVVRARSRVNTDRRALSLSNRTDS